MIMSTAILFFRECLGTFCLTLTIGLTCWLPATRYAVMAAGLCLMSMFFVLKTKDSVPQLNPAVSFAAFCWKAINESVSIWGFIMFLFEIAAQTCGAIIAGAIIGGFMLSRKHELGDTDASIAIQVYPWKTSDSLSNDFCLALLATLLFILVSLRVNYARLNSFPSTGPFILGIAYSAGLYVIGDYCASGMNSAVPLGLIIANLTAGLPIPETGSFHLFVAYMFATGISSVGAVILHALVELTDTSMRQPLRTP